MKAELIGKYNMSVGMVLLVETDTVLKVGEKIKVENEEYTIKGFMHPTGFFDNNKVSVIV